ncbi:MAG: peptidylprolyl isomerase [Syntrophaceae bacterium]|nr:peptidylprolyl isomerase [Syntrophaceae bacterium]
MRGKIYFALIALLLIIVFAAGCEKDSDVKETPATEPIDQSQSIRDKIVFDTESVLPSDIAVSVDGKVLKNAQLEKQINDVLKIYKDQIPKDKIKKARVSIKTQIVDNFIIRTVLENEIEKRKIVAEDKEVQEVVDGIKANIEPGQNFEEFLKANKMTVEELKKNIATDIKIKKLVTLELKGKSKPTSGEIRTFYKENKDKFTIPESVHLRHILIAINEKDDDKIKAEKKEKIENIRQQIVDGADFAEVAKKNSDCPTKESGGDLGNITRGQTVKPFEDAAFSQKIKVLGPVITTEYGYHIIEVLDRNPEKIISLDDVKEKISGHLEQQKQSEAFASLMKKLRDKAQIKIN